MPSGRYRVRWRDAEGNRQRAEQTFATVTEARAFLATVQADMLRRTCKAPRRVTETLADYGTQWIEGRPGIKESTRHQYGIDFRRHIEPYLGARKLDRIEPEVVRRWHNELGRRLRQELADDGGAAPMRSMSGPDGSATVARSYRLLRAILQTAVDDELLVRNPCKIAGAGDPRSVERPGAFGPGDRGAGRGGAGPLPGLRDRRRLLRAAGRGVGRAADHGPQPF
jgi:hypothetical protein